MTTARSLCYPCRTEAMAFVCSQCGRENLDHYKFCLGCGRPLAPAAAPAASIPEEAAGAATQPPVFATAAPATPPAGLASRPAAAPVAAALATASRPCPSCGAAVPASFVFCGSCGARMEAAATPVEAGKTMIATAAQLQPAARGRLVLVRPDGSEGGSQPLQDGENLVGRGQGGLFDSDPYLSPRHALITFGPGGAIVEDLGSLNGVFLKIPEEEEVQDGDVLRIGQELIRFQAFGEPEALDDGTQVMGSPNPGYWGRLSVIVGPDQEGGSYPMQADQVVLGRDRGDITFPDDGYVSGRHCRIASRGGRTYLADMGSSNGTFLRIREARVVPSGTLMLVGQQLFRLDYR